MEDCVVLLGTTILNLLRSLLSLPSFLRANWSVRFYPSDLSLASCTTTSCLCKSCQRTLSYRSLPTGENHRFSESECKGTTFSRTGKIFQGIFLEKLVFLRFGWWKSRKNGHYRRIWANTCGNERGIGYGGDLQITAKSKQKSTRRQERGYKGLIK